MEESTKFSFIQKLKDRKIFIPAIVGGLIVILGTGSLILLKTTDRSADSEQVKMAPSEDQITNPLNIEALLGFASYDIALDYNRPAVIDLYLETYKSTGIAEGILKVTYNPYTITEVKVEPVVGPTGLFPKLESFDVKYYPDSFVITFKIPEGSTPITGKGRVAEVSLVPVEFAKEPDNTTITYDFEGSQISTQENGTKRTLKISKSDLLIRPGNSATTVSTSNTILAPVNSQ